jgi:hypothetical protein
MKDERLLLWIGVILSAAALGGGCLYVGYLTGGEPDFSQLWELLVLAPGIIGLWFCLKRLYDHWLMTDRPLAQIGPVPRAELPTVEARAAAGLCPRCGTPVAPADQDCPICSINLAWARDHLDELAGNETP